MGFDSSSPYYVSSDNDGGIGGTECIMISFTPEGDDHSWLGASKHDGASKAFAKVKEGLNEENLYKKATAWQHISSAHASWDTDLHTVATSIFETPGVWEGDDADAALKIFNGTLASSTSLKGYSANMAKNVGDMHTAVSTAKGVSSNNGDSGFLGTGAGASDGDGSKDTEAYMKLAGAVDGSRQKMPMNVAYQNKADGGATQLGGNAPGGLPGGVGSGGAGVGGAAAASHIKGPSVTGIKQPGALPNDNGVNPTDHNGVDPINTTDPITDPGYSGNPSTYDPSDPGVGAYAAPTLDSGTSLAGLDPNSAGGFGSGAGGGGSLAGAGAGGLGSGAGAFGGSGAGLAGMGAGAGAGGGSLAGAGLAGAGAGGAGLSAAETAAAGAGRSGNNAMMPMRGGAGGGSGGDDERERSTWLTEDDDIWGVNEEAPPSTIS